MHTHSIITKFAQIVRLSWPMGIINNLSLSASIQLHFSSGKRNRNQFFEIASCCQRTVILVHQQSAAITAITEFVGKSSITLVCNLSIDILNLQRGDRF